MISAAKVQISKKITKQFCDFSVRQPLPAPLRGGVADRPGRGVHRRELLTPPLPLPYMGGECHAAYCFTSVMVPRLR